jgi:hypothetical protein
MQATTTSPNAYVCLGPNRSINKPKLSEVLLRTRGRPTSKDGTGQGERVDKCRPSVRLDQGLIIGEPSDQRRSQKVERVYDHVVEKPNS